RLKNMYRTLRSVDDAVNTIITVLSDTNRLANTLIVFASDNGYDWSEHRMSDKLIPYEESIRVPMVARWDGVISPRTDPHIVANVDLAPTFADVGGVSAVGAEGMDMTPLFTDPNAPWRQDLLVEHMQNTLVRDPVTT